jgi:hypothetical protein
MYKSEIALVLNDESERSILEEMIRGELSKPFFDQHRGFYNSLVVDHSAPNLMCFAIYPNADALFLLYSMLNRFCRVNSDHCRPMLICA